MSKRSLYFIVIVLLFICLSSAGENVVSGNQRAENRIKTKKANDLQGDLINGNMYVLGGKVSSAFQQRIVYDQSSDLYHVEYDSNIYELTAELDPDLVLKHSEWSAKNKDMINNLGYDKRVTTYDPARGALRIDYYKGQECKETKWISCNGATVDSDLIYLYLRQVLTENSGCEVVVKSRGIKIDVTFSQISTNDLLGFTPQYASIEGFRAFADGIMEQGEELDVYVMNLNGLAKWFFPYKYYIAFRQDPPLQFVAYWGGPPKSGEFTYIE